MRYLLVAAVIGLLVWLKLALCSNQLLELYPNSAPMDDELMFGAAREVFAGNWLGDYNYLTIAKHMFFSVWLAGVMKLGIPYVIACELMYLISCAAAALAVRPLFKKTWPMLLVFCALWMSPYSWAAFTLRVYRDSIYSSLCLLFFAGIVGMCARYKEPLWRSLVFAALGGLGFGLSWITREDGIWLVPFALCAAAVYIIMLIINRVGARSFAKRMGAVVLSVAVALACIGAFCYENYVHYGRFIVSDFSSGEFEDAVGALIRADSDRPHDDNVLVCYEARQKIAEVSPMWAEIENFIAQNPALYGSYGFGADTKEFKSGGFCWALRRIVSELGYADTALKAREYYQSLADEINAACDSGLIQTPYSKMSTTLMPFDGTYVGRTLAEVGNSIKLLLTFDQTSSIARGNYGLYDEVSSYLRLLHTNTANEYDENGAIIVYDYQTAAESKFTVIRTVYKIAIWPMLALGFVGLALDIADMVGDLRRKKTGMAGLRGIVLLGLLLCVLLRVGIISYIEAVSFKIGTYLLYLASAGPPLLMFVSLGTASVVCRIIAKRRKKNAAAPEVPSAR